MSAQHLELLRWLTGHLDNPYPSLSAKKALCRRSGLSMKTTNEWFSHVRRRIGWTSILKRHFKGDRQLTVDCANRILVERSGPMYYSDDICQDIENMRVAAERLYAKKYRQSSLSKNLDNSVNDRAGPSRGARFSSPSQLSLTACDLNKSSPHDCLPSNDLGFESRSYTSSQPTVTKKRTRDTSISDKQDGSISWYNESTEGFRPVKKLKYVILVH